MPDASSPFTRRSTTEDHHGSTQSLSSSHAASISSRSLADDLLLFNSDSNSNLTSCSIQHEFDPQQHQRVYTVGVLAIRGVDAAYQEFNTTFSDYLTLTAGRRYTNTIQFIMKPLTFTNLFDEAETQRIDYIYVNPSAFSCIESEYTARSIVSQISRRVIQGKTYNLKKFGGVIMARSDRDDIRTIHDLRGKVVAAAAISGLGSGQMQFLEMVNAGLSYVNDPKQLVFTSNQGKIVQGVLNRTFDVGFIRTDQLERSKDWDGNPVNLDDFKIIGPKAGLEIDGTPFPFETSTPLYPEWNLASLDHVSDDISRQVQSAMLALEEHASVGRELLSCQEELLLQDGDANDTDACAEEIVFQRHRDNGNQIRCDTTLEIAETALAAMEAGKYSGWQTTLSYMQLRAMQEATGFIQLSPEDNVWRCIRPSMLYEAISCPNNYLRKSESDVLNGCAQQGLECADGYQCLCSPCEEIVECTNGVEMGQRCVAYSVLLPSILIPCAVLAALLLYWYTTYKDRQADSVFHIDPDELNFMDPPVIIGQGTFGQVLLAEFRGTQVAVKRVIPPAKEDKRGLFDTGNGGSYSSRKLANVQLMKYRARYGHTVGNGSGRPATNSDERGSSSYHIGDESWNDVEAPNQGSASLSSINLGLVSLGPDILRRSRNRGLNSSLSGIRSASLTGRNSRSYSRLKSDFIVEMRHLARLRHPCIATVMGAVISRKEEPMLVMEYMANGSLFDVLHNPSIPMDSVRKFLILQNIVQGLRFLHAANPEVIHGDLKSQNVLVNANFSAKVTDFGLSAKKTLNAVGTPYWMAPELLRGETSNTAASDMYSFGIVMFEVLSREVPYHGEDHETVLKDVCNLTRNKRPKLPNDCSERVVKMYKQCVDGHPENRPTAEQLDLFLKVEQKVAEETDTLEATNKELEKANRKIASAAALQLQHFACMSHEIRTPLNCIIGLSSLMEESDLTLQQRESMQMIVSSGNLLRCIVDDVLDYSKLESGNVVIDVKRINLQVVLSGVIQSIRISPVAESKHLDIRCDYSSSLTEHMHMDSRRLQQILYNLLSNAIKFSQINGLVEFRVAILKDPKSSTVVHPDSGRIIRFTVLDHGKGIEMADFKKIFEPFKQTRTGIDNLDGGTGLGLAITKRLVEALGGCISVDSVVGEWTQFTVDFPFPGQTAALEKAADRLASATIYLIGDPSENTKRALAIFGLFSIRVSQHQDLASCVQEFGRRNHTNRSIIYLLQEDKYDASVFENLPESTKTSLVTFGPKFTVKHAKFHYHSLTDVFPIVLLETLGSCVANTNPVLASRRWSNVNPKDIAHATKVPLEKLRLMIADDNLVNQKVLKRIVNRLGIQNVEVVGNGKEAVELEASQPFDIVLMDMQMPVMDGLEACKLINRRVGGHQRAKIIFVTAHVSDDFKATCLENGASGYLPKPCTLDTVKKVIQDAAPLVTGSFSAGYGNEDAKTPDTHHRRPTYQGGPASSLSPSKQQQQKQGDDGLKKQMGMPPLPPLQHDNSNNKNSQRQHRLSQNNGGSLEQAPRRDSATPTTQPPNDAADVTTPPPTNMQPLTFADLRVLIADDIVVNQKVLKRIVNRIGIKSVKVVDDGRKAADLEAAEPFDVVLMDLQMPVMDGLESCKIIVNRTPSISEGNRHPPAKVVFVTAHVSEEFKTTCMENGAVGYLPKPCSVDSVKGILQQVLSIE